MKMISWKTLQHSTIKALTWGTIALIAISNSTPEIAKGLTKTIITIDPTTTYQTITGWEAVTEVGQEDTPDAYNATKDVLFKMASEVGVNRLRLSIRSGAENTRDYWSEYQSGQINYETWRSHRYATVNDNDDPFNINGSGFHFSELDDRVQKVVIPLKNQLDASGEQLQINLLYVAFTGQIGSGLHYHHDDPEEYAEFILTASLHLREKFNLIPNTWEVILEPDNVQQWNANLIGQAVLATAERLKANGFDPKFVAPSSTSMCKAANYFDQMVQIPGVLQYIQELSYHRYSCVSDESLQRIHDLAIQHGVDTAMLEWWHSNNTYKTLHQDLALGRNSAWQQGVLAGPTSWNPTEAIILIDDSDPGNIVARLTEKTKYNRQYFKFIRPGALRIEAASNDPILNPLAFINADGMYVVVIAADSGAFFEIRGLPAGTYGIKYTTGDGKSQPTAYDINLPDITINPGEYISSSIPETGVITIYGKSALPPLLGDLNLDSVIDQVDIQICTRVILGSEGDLDIAKRADLNADGEINALDLQEIVVIYLNENP